MGIDEIYFIGILCGFVACNTTLAWACWYDYKHSSDVRDRGE